MAQFQIKRGLSSSLFDDQGNLLIQPEEGCWYLTVDTAELYVCNDGSTVEKINGSGTFEALYSASTFKNLPNVGNSHVVYTVVDENATYRWNDNDMTYHCIGRDYKEIDIINGGNASAN